MNIRVPDNITAVCRILEQAGYEAGVVGGCVRDTLLGRTPDDWDVCTAARPEEIKACFADAGFRTIDTGIRHGTVTVLTGGEPCEVTTYRIDGTYSDRRHPDRVHFSRNMREDLSRRDFTVNAMAYRPCPDGSDKGAGQIFDPFGGQKDLKRRLIRAVGDPARRFDEDALRILRALRFSAVLGFSLEPDTERAVRRLAGTVQAVSAERIAEEMRRLLSGRAAGRILASFREEIGVVTGTKPGAPERIAAAGLLAAGAEGPDLPAEYVLLFGDAAEATLMRLRYERKMVRSASAVRQMEEAFSGIAEVGRSELTEALRTNSKEDVESVLRLREALRAAQKEEAQRGSAERETLARLLSDGTPLRRGDLAVNGADLLDVGIPPGPAVGEALEKLLSAVQRDGVPNQKDALLAVAEQFAARS